MQLNEQLEIEQAAHAKQAKSDEKSNREELLLYQRNDMQTIQMDIMQQQTKQNSGMMILE